MERIKSALDKARLERERLQQKSELRQANDMENTKLSEVDALRTQLLARAPFSHCTAEQQRALLRDGSFMELAAGDTLQFAGEIDGYIHYLLSGAVAVRSEEHTSELQSRSDLVCRLLLEKKNENSSQ